VAALAKTQADVRLNLNNAATKAKKARQEQEMLLTTNEATTEQAEAQVDFNQSELAQAKRQYERQQSLADDQLVPVREAELAELNRQGKQLSVVTASKKLEVQEHTEKIGVSKGEMLIEDARFSLEAARNKAEQQVANAKFNVTRAQHMLALAKLRMGWCTVKAPISGLVVLEREYDPAMGTERPLRAGDEVDEEERLMDIIDTGQMIVQADVGEIDIGQVRAGQAARIMPRSAPGVALKGKVKSVSEVAQAPPTWRTNNLPGKKVFRVTITLLDSRPELLRPGMTADFEIVRAEIAGGVRVPIQAVFEPSGVQEGPDNGRAPGTRPKGGTSGGKGDAVTSTSHDRTPKRPNTGVVSVTKEGRFWAKTVTLGRRNDVDVLVTKGVNVGDVLAERMPPASLIGPATRNQQQAWAVRFLELLPWGLGR
jgi:multidrug resistance efflux pump